MPGSKGCMTTITSLTTLNDKQLIDAHYKGDASAFDELHRRYFSRSYRLSYKFLRNHHDAEDCSQEILVKIFETKVKNRYDPTKGASFKTWADRIAANTVINYHKKRKKSARDTSFDETYQAPDENTSISREPIIDKSVPNKLMILSCFEIITEEEKFIVILHIVIGFKQKEIAVIMGISAPRVNQKLKRALNKLKLCLVEQMKNQGGM
ncbi:MAG: RNA polymerase sigma factor [Candidatus Eremiobacteraeota bacterium]|nr:RNA polymerase sigma factor [Candidatus Eremiobacteraeota bacterium]